MNEKLFISRFMAHIEESEAWYIDLGCSTHMTSQEELLTRINYNCSGKVIFGDDRDFEVKGKCTIAIPTLHGKINFIEDTLLTVRQHRYSNRGRTPSVTTHITRSKINTSMF
jgi:hypothetical protein